MDKEQIEKELNDICDKTKKIIDDAYVRGYRDGYFECMLHKYAAKQEDEEIKDKFQVSI